MVDLKVKIARIAGGIDLPYVMHGDPAGPPFILMHGYAGSWLDFEPLMAHIPEWIRAIAFTQRGQGYATKPELGYSVAELAADLAAFLDSLQIGKAVIAGGSSGGIIARRFALDFPSRTRALILLGSPATLANNPAIEELWTASFSKLQDPVDPVFIRDFVLSLSSEPLEPDFLARLIQQTMHIPARVWRETFVGLMQDSSLESLHRIDAPVLLLWGSKDTLISREDQLRMANAIRHARLIEYPGLDHVFYWQQPLQVGADIANFIKTLDWQP